MTVRMTVAQERDSKRDGKVACWFAGSILGALIQCKLRIPFVGLARLAVEGKQMITFSRARLCSRGCDTRSGTVGGAAAMINSLTWDACLGPSGPL